MGTSRRDAVPQQPDVLTYVRQAQILFGVWDMVTGITLYGQGMFHCVPAPSADPVQYVVHDNTCNTP